MDNCTLYYQLYILLDLQQFDNPRNRRLWLRIITVPVFRLPLKFEIFYYPNTIICSHGTRHPKSKLKLKLLFVMKLLRDLAIKDSRIMFLLKYLPKTLMGTI